MIRQGVGGSVDNVRRPTAQDKRVAIRCGAGDAADPEAARSATDILYDDGSPERDPHSFRQDAADCVGGAARRKRDNQSDGPRRIGLGRHAC